MALEPSNKLAEQVINLQYVIEEKERAIEVLRQALEHQRKLSANFSQKFQKELNQRLAAQKTEYEATIHRHQNFIDQLIEDKKVLAERCDGLNLEMANNERKFQDTLKNLGKYVKVYVPIFHQLLDVTIFEFCSNAVARLNSSILGAGHTQYNSLFPV